MAEAENDLLISFRVGAVRAGVQATMLALALLVVFWAVPEHGRLQPVPYALVLVAAVAGGTVAWRLPWARMFGTGLGIRALYLWSVLDILLITVAVRFTGGGGSDLYLLYCLTTVFFGAAYPRRGHVPLLLFTWACYLAVLGLTGWTAPTGVVVLRCGILGIVAALTSFVSGELLGHVESLHEARSAAERWAGLLSTVTASTRQMTLDRIPALEALVATVIDLGFEGAGIAVFDHEATTFEVPHHRGLPAEFVLKVHPSDSGVLGQVRSEGRTAILDDAHALPGEERTPLRDAGFRSVVASPIWVDGWMTGALFGGNRQPGVFSPQGVEAFELLSAHIGLVMENAHRFEETLHTVEHLEELDRLKDDFLATASHEIRTPLTVILGSGITLEERWEELDDSLRRELLDGMNRNARALDGLVGSLLDFARLGADTQRIEPKPCPMAELAGGVAGRLAPLFTDRGLAVEIEAGAVVLADPVLLERVVENLLANAAKHTPPGTSVRLSVAVEGRTVVIAVSDDGPGISPEDVVHLGERFYRGGDLNSRPTKGLGLGLALAREILELHGTVLEIESTPRRGSRFAFRLRSADGGAGSADSALGSLDGTLQAPSASVG